MRDPSDARGVHRQKRGGRSEAAGRVRRRRRRSARAEGEGGQVRPAGRAPRELRRPDAPDGRRLVPGVLPRAPGVLPAPRGRLREEDDGGREPPRGDGEEGTGPAEPQPRDVEEPAPHVDRVPALGRVRPEVGAEPPERGDHAGAGVSGVRLLREDRREGTSQLRAPFLFRCRGRAHPLVRSSRGPLRRRWPCA